MAKQNEFCVSDCQILKRSLISTTPARTDLGFAGGRVVGADRRSAHRSSTLVLAALEVTVAVAVVVAGEGTDPHHASVRHRNWTLSGFYWERRKENSIDK